jgi:hypothetical protein
MSVIKTYDKASVRVGTKADAYILGPNLKGIDTLEVSACSGGSNTDGILSAFDVPNSKVYTIVDDSDNYILAMFGCGDCLHDSGFGVPWLLATKRLEKHSKQFLRHNRKWVQEISGEYEVLYNYIHTSNTIGQRWLSWCGFDIKTGFKHRIGGEPFYLFTKGSVDV